MFENILKGFSFIKQSFILITKDGDLIKPSIYSIFTGILFTVIAGITIYLSRESIPAELVYILVFLVLLGEYYISYFFTGMTAFLVYDYFKDGDATMSEAWTAAKKNALTLFYLSIVSAIVKIVIEDRDLKGAVARASDIMQKHLLPIGVGEIAVGLVTGLLTIIGFIVAIVLGISIFGAMSSATGAILAILIAAVIIVLVIALSMYVTTAYHTCLFLWARDVEDAGAGVSGTVKPPAPIANTLGV